MNGGVKLELEAGLIYDLIVALSSSLYTFIHTKLIE